VLALGGRYALPPSAPAGISVVERGSRCILDVPGEGALCPCERIPPRIRWVLRLPLPLNRVGAKDLSLLPGIGPVRASAIVEDRAEHGAFATVRALTRVRGIGSKTVERLRPFLFVGDTDPACVE
jgi:competence ComEA-like helix-hairpin-helix protein